MSLTGQIHVYTEHRPPQLESIFLRVAQWSGADEIHLVSQGRAILEGEPLSGDSALGFSELELVSKGRVSHGTFWKFYEEGLVLRGVFQKSPRAREIASAVSAGIDADVRGKFVPYDMSLSIGSYRMINDVENPGEIVGRPFFEIGFFGYGIPENWVATRTQIRALPAIVKVQQELTAIVGLEMQVNAMWSC